MNILQKIPGERFSEVVPSWKGALAVIIAGGPSLSFEQIAKVREYRDAGRVFVVAVNDAYLVAPWADVHYAADSKWHKWHEEGIERPVLRLSATEVRDRWASFAGEKSTICTSGANVTDSKVHVLRNAAYPMQHSMGLSVDPRRLVTGRNSGFQALNLSTLAGIRGGILLGFDGRPAPDGKTHFCGAHPHQTTPLAAYPYYREAMSAAEGPLREAGIQIINSSPDSFIDTFQKLPLAIALGLLERENEEATV